MTARRLPPHGKQFADARARGLVPRRLGHGHLAVVLNWNERRTGAMPRLVLEGDPASFDLSFLAGLDVLLLHTRRDATRMADAVTALLNAGALHVEVVDHNLREQGAPMERWWTMYEQEELRHAA